MCLITEQKKPLLTKRTRIVYKTVIPIDNTNETKVRASYMHSFIYELGKVYQTSFSYLPIDDNDALPFDCFVSDIYGSNLAERILYHQSNKIIVVAQGFHSAKTINRFSDGIDCDEVLVKCTIPIGSLIHQDKTGLIVSNKIIIDKIIKL